MIKLQKVTNLHIKPQHPYNFRATVDKPSHFPATTDIFENNILYFAMNWQDYLVGIKIYELNENISVEIFSENDLHSSIIDEIRNELIYRFNMNTDLSKFIQLAESEPILKPIEMRYRGMHASCAYSLYELLCISLVLQNAQINRSVKMLDIMLCTFGKKVCFDSKILSVFWKPIDIIKTTEEYLRSLKIGYRAKSFLKISEFFNNNTNFEFELKSKSKEEASKELQKIYGIGPASTWYLLFEKLHHYDAFDYISPWENKILSKLFFDTFDKPTEDILKYAKEKWGNYRMLAVHYIFEDVFWKRRNENIEWLNQLVRL